MTNIITPTLIADKLGLSVSDQDIGRAQTVIETIMDVNLSGRCDLRGQSPRSAVAPASGDVADRLPGGAS